MATKKQQAWSVAKILFVIVASLFALVVYVKSILYIKYWMSEVCVTHPSGIQECNSRIILESTIRLTQVWLIIFSLVIFIIGSIALITLVFRAGREIYEDIDDRVKFSHR